MISVAVKCPNCGKSLMNSAKKLDAAPSIEVTLSYAGKRAPLFLSSMYGSYKVETELTMPVGKVAGFRCTHCDADLKSTRKCDACGSQMIAFELKAGGQVQICSRRGCKKHVLEFQDADSELQAFYKSYLKALK
jgi:methionyl-tRNA synthetase